MTDDQTTVSIAPQAIIKRKRSRWVLLLVVVIILIAGLAGRYYVLNKKSDKQADTSMTTDQFAQYQQAQSLAASVENTDPITKAIQLTGAASLMAQAGQQQKSLDYYLEAQKVVDENNLRQTAALDYSEQIADTYAKLGDKTKSRQYYTKAIDFIKSQTGDPDITKKVNSLEAKRNKL